MEVKILKTRKGVPTVIEWNSKEYVLKPTNIKKKGTKKAGR
jgi:hypothetical protein